MDGAGTRCGCDEKPLREEEEKVAAGGGCGQLEATDAAFRSVARALASIQAVIGALDAKVEGTRRAVDGLQLSVRDKGCRVEALRKRVDEVEQQLAFDSKLEEFFRPLAAYLPHRPPVLASLPAPPPDCASVSTSTSTSDLPSLCSDGSSGSYLGSSSFTSGTEREHSVPAPVAIAISVPNSVSAAFPKSMNCDLRDSTVILRFIPVSQSGSVSNAASDSSHKNTTLPITNSECFTASVPENCSNCGCSSSRKALSNDRSPSCHKISLTTTVESDANLDLRAQSVHEEHSVRSPISAPETNSNYITNGDLESKSVNFCTSTFRPKSILKLSSLPQIKPINVTSDSELKLSKITSIKRRSSAYKSHSTPEANVQVKPVFTSTPNLNFSVRNSNFPLAAQITPTYIPACAPHSSPPVRFPSSISCSSLPPRSAAFARSSMNATLSPFSSIVNYSSSFLSDVSVPSGCRSLLIQTVSSTVRPLAAHSSRVMSVESLAPASAGAQLASESPSSSGGETDSMCAIKYIALPHFQRSACAQTEELVNVFMAPNVGLGEIAPVPAVNQDEGSRGVRARRSTPIQTEFAFGSGRTTGEVTSVGVCTSKAGVSVHAATSIPPSVAVATSVSTSIPVSMSKKFASWTQPEYQLLTGKTLTSLGKELLKAAYEGRPADVELILRAGVDVNYTCGSTWTPLHRASWGGHAGVVALLLHRGADVRATTAFGFTALHIAAYNDPGGECVRLLVGAGAELDAKNRLGWTPLHYAAEGGRSAAVRTLVQSGASAMIRSARGKTPFHVARTKKIRELLLTGHCNRLIEEDEEEEIEVF